MKHYLKRSMEWVIALKRKIRKSPFEVARVRLTIFYTAITMAIVGLFSIALLVSLEHNTRMVVADEFIIPDELSILAPHQPEAIENVLPPQKNMMYPQHVGNELNRFLVFRRTIDDLEHNIFVADGLLLFIAAFLGYVIAGRTLRPIKENVDIQKRFLADASHDLRTPLAIMKSEAQVLLQSGSRDHADFEEVVRSNLEEIDKMSHLVDDLLIIARTEELPDKETFGDVQVGELLEKVAKKFAPRAEKQQISFVHDIISDSVVRGDAYQLERVFQNVLQNALNYTKAGGSITITSSHKGGTYVVKIKDTGVGISKIDLPHIFDRFYKASHSRSDGVGSGLGLTIVRQIIDRHGGSVHVESEVGVGTSIELRLPVA